MERKKDKRPLWIKKTPGTLILRKPTQMRLKPKQKFRATVEELGKFVDQFELLDKGKGKYKATKESMEEAQKPEAPKGEVPPREDYELKHMGGGKYDVVSPSGKVMNDKRLNKENATALKEKLDTQDEPEE